MELESVVLFSDVYEGRGFRPVTVTTASVWVPLARC